MASNDAVAQASGPIAGRSADWFMVESLLAGTRAMRAAGEKLMPRFPMEEQPAYDARMKVATLFPAFQRTVGVMAGKPFSRSLTFGADVPEVLKGWCENIDLQGSSLHVLAKEMLAEGLAYGLCGYLVDAPKAGAAGPSMAEQQKAGVRPYVIRVKHDRLLGWRVEEANGQEKLTQLRLRECATVPDGPYGQKLVDRVRVYEPGRYELWEKLVGPRGGYQEWVMIESGPMGLPYIPFVPVYGRRCGFMDGCSPLLDQAFLNVKHWQSQSDQDNILHVARVPILSLSGGDKDTNLTVATNTAVILPQGAELKYVEHTGKAIEAGQTSLDALENQMIRAGAELLVEKVSGDRTATESNNDAEANRCELQSIAEDQERAIDQVLQVMADYASLGAGGHVNVYKDFGASNLSDASAQLVKDMAIAGIIDNETAINELKRRGTLAAEVDPAVVADKVKEQGPALGLIPPPAKTPAQTPAKVP